jgi:F420-dependent oxidoreductase-like protein
MLIGIFEPATGDAGTIDAYVASAARAHADGMASFWLPQIFGLEALSVLAIVGREVPGIALGTAVVPTYPRHPVTMAQLALTTQHASQGRLTLGIGLSHQVVIESMMGLSFDKPARHMKEYLEALMPLLHERSVATTGETISVSAGLMTPRDIPAPQVVVAALGPKMLALCGAMTDGTVTWMTGPKTLESHIVPSVRAAAEGAGRPAPRVVAALPVCVTEDVAGAKERCAELFQIYGFLPSYRAMLDREGAEGPADVAIVGSEAEVAETIASFAGIGVTEFVAVEFGGNADETERTRAVLKSLIG